MDGPASVARDRSARSQCHRGRAISFLEALGEPLGQERRLFYVACTRAKDQLILTHAAARGGRPTGGPSRFLSEAGLIDPSQALAA